MAYQYTDDLAEKLVTGEVGCSHCSGLQALVEDVKTGEMSMEEFKTILADAKAKSLQKVV